MVNAIRNILKSKSSRVFELLKAEMSPHTRDNIIATLDGALQVCAHYAASLAMQDRNANDAQIYMKSKEIFQQWWRILDEQMKS